MVQIKTQQKISLERLVKLSRITNKSCSDVSQDKSVQCQALQLLVALLLSLRHQLALSEEQRLGPHEGLVLLQLRLGEVLLQQAGHHAASLVYAGLQCLCLLKLLQQFLSLVLYIFLQ